MGSCYNRPGVSCDLKHPITVKKRLNFILENLEIKENDIILDIGTGLGTYINEFIPYVKTCVGIDTNDEYLKITKKKILKKKCRII